MANILVTGGAGFIASETAAALARRRKADQIVVVDNLVTGSSRKVPESPHGNITFIKCDVNRFNDIASVFYGYGFDYVFHYAALVGVERTLSDPVRVLEDIQGIRNLLDLSKNTGVKRVYYSSSSEVYGEPVEIPQNELTTPLNSRLPYAIVKNVGEAFLRAYQQEFGLNYTIFRFFNTYGIKQSQDFVISRFIDSALKDEDLVVYGDGQQTRTFCYVDDNVEACLNAFEQDKCINDVVNIGSADEITIKELAEKVIRLSGTKAGIFYAPPLEEGDMRRRKPDNTKMLELLDRDLVPLDEGLKQLLERPHYILQ